MSLLSSYERSKRKKKTPASATMLLAFDPTWELRCTDRIDSGPCFPLLRQMRLSCRCALLLLFLRRWISAPVCYWRRLIWALRHLVLLSLVLLYPCSPPGIIRRRRCIPTLMAELHIAGRICRRCRNKLVYCSVHLPNVRFGFPVMWRSISGDMALPPPRVRLFRVRICA